MTTRSIFRTELVDSRGIVGTVYCWTRWDRPQVPPYKHLLSYWLLLRWRPSDFYVESSTSRKCRKQSRKKRKDRGKLWVIKCVSSLNELSITDKTSGYNSSCWILNNKIRKSKGRKNWTALTWTSYTQVCEYALATRQYTLTRWYARVCALGLPSPPLIEGTPCPQQHFWPIKWSSLPGKELDMGFQTVSKRLRGWSAVLR